ncbi:MAG: alkaline phosphatase family protein [Acidobacteriota bacterium]|nr:MAG: alkaline phosphatase family protein [Acidobacteriota bacterium]UCF81455.1 MAG: alkaline phosphatase family protein [Acidobacteriota bacterium]
MRRAGRFPVFLLTVAALGFLASCSPDKPAFEGRAAVIGIDGADWDLVQRYIAEGKMPALARLQREGASGILESMEPMISPVLWTSLATGLPPEEHGILTFWRDNRGFATTSDRKGRPLWVRVSEGGGSAGVIGWLISYPAENIRGYVVSDRTAVISFLRSTPTDINPKGKTHPPELFQEILPLVVEPSSVKDEEVLSLFALGGAPDDSTTWGHLRAIAAQTRTYEAVALRMLRRESVNLFAVYFQGIDSVSHLCMEYLPPRLPHVSEEDAALYGGAIEAFYRHQDAVVGRILEKLPPDATVYVVSDHGFRHSHDRLTLPASMDEGYADAWHRKEGALFVRGPGVRPGFRIEGATIYDFAPTVLDQLGLPASDLPGRALREIFSDPVGAGEASEEQALREKLQSLGYIGAGGEQIAPASNLGLSYARRGEWAKAEELYREALSENPNDWLTRRRLGECLIAQERFEEALGQFEKILGAKPRDTQAALGWAEAASALGRPQEARAPLERALERHAYNPDLYAALAEVLLALGQEAEAHELARKALELHPDHARAKAALGKMTDEE